MKLLSTWNHTSDISYSVIFSGTLVGMLLTSGCVFPFGAESEVWGRFHVGPT